MDISRIVAIVAAEYKAFRDARDRRAHLTGRAAVLYVLYVLPINLPGPFDSILHAGGKAVTIFMVGILYDAVLARYESDEPNPPWPSLPGYDATAAPHDAEEVPPCNG